MVKNFTTFLSIIIASSLLTSCMNEEPKQIKQEKKESNLKTDKVEAFVGFAFLNEKKDSLVSLAVEDEKIKPEAATHAIIENKITPIDFSVTKPESESSNGRQTSHNFSNNGGTFFSLKEQIKEGDFALIVNQKFIDQNQILPFKKINKETNEQIKLKIAKQYNRKISQSSTLAELNNKNKAQINITLFEVKNDSALAVLTYLHNDQLITLDFPAKYDEMSTWRVDDGGVFDFENLQLLSIFQSDKSIKIATVFWGAEGYNLNFYESVDGVFKNIAEAYGYSAPL